MHNSWVDACHGAASRKASLLCVWPAQAIYGVWRYDTPLYMGAMAEMMRRRGAPPADVPKDLAQRQLVCATCIFVLLQCCRYGVSAAASCCCQTLVQAHVHQCAYARSYLHASLFPPTAAITPQPSPKKAARRSHVALSLVSSLFEGADDCGLPTQDVLQLTPAQQQAMVAQYESMLARLKAISAMPEAQLATAEARTRTTCQLPCGLLGHIAQMSCRSLGVYRCQADLPDAISGEPARSRLESLMIEACICEHQPLPKT